VKYKRSKSLFWKKIKNVVGDSTLTINDSKINYRVFFLEDNTRMEIPLTDTVFVFSKERFDLIKQNINKESGVKI